MKIQVVNRMTIENTKFTIPDRHVLISVTDPGDKANIPDRPTCQGILRLEFNDTYRYGRPGVQRVIFSAKQAREVLDFVDEWKGKVPLLVVHCFAGMNRSPAVAAAVSRVLGQGDEFFFKKYDPDAWVYRTILDVAYGG